MARRPQQKASQKRASSGFIRIISGLWRGRKLPVHDAQGLRPTTDRVKETLFNWLAQDIPGAICLDVFAGSGGLGFESASRQAQKVTLVELNPAAFSVLKKNAQALNADNIDVVNSDALQYLKTSPTPQDVVFIDPPFRQGLLAETMHLLETQGWLAEGALIYIETEKELTLDGVPQNWRLHREKSAGQVSYRLFERTPV
ncbi:16S rRNA (guanine(966)-N(2))-methyltransferase RsmD [Vibrio sp. AK197]